MSFLDRLRRLLEGVPGSDAESGAEEEVGGCRQISCPEALARIQEFLDGELEGVSQREVAQHFSVCKKCYPHLKLETRFRELLQRAATVESCPEEVRRHVLELLEGEASRPV